MRKLEPHIAPNSGQFLFAAGPARTGVLFRVRRESTARDFRLQQPAQVADSRPPLRATDVKTAHFCPWHFAAFGRWSDGRFALKADTSTATQNVKGFGCRPIARVRQAPGPPSESLHNIRNPSQLLP